MARELAKLGHHVRVFSNCERPGKYDGVAYMPIEQWQVYAPLLPHDVTIVQRTPEAFTTRMNSRLNVLWCHDLALLRQARPYRGTMWNVDRVFVVSEFMKRQYEEVYGLPNALVYATRNGIDLDRFARVATDAANLGMVRDRKRLICAARPERGLDVLLQAILPRILKEEPEARLHLCGYDNPVGHMQEFYQHIDRLIRGFGDRVVWLGHLTKDQLYAQYLTAGVYAYPTPSSTSPMFSEVSCISAMEAQAAGLPIVTSNRGALPETVAPGAGTLVDGDPWTEEYQVRFVDAVLELLRNDEAWIAASATGFARARELGWAGVAREWTDLFERLIAERNDSPHRLAAHFMRHTDIIAAKHVLENLDDGFAQDLRKHLARDYWFTEAQDGYREEYERIGQTHRPSFEGETSETRFKASLERLQAVAPKRVLDYGCAHGAYTVGLSNHMPETVFQGVDIDKHGIAWALRFRAEKAAHPGNLSFRVGDENVDLSDQEPFDALFCGETIEHLPAAWEAISKIERWVKPGGLILITTPYGPWEYLSAVPGDPNYYPHRAHIWEYDLHDLRDMFGSKPEFAIDTMAWGTNDVTGEPHGWHLITYRADHQPLGRIDMARKLHLQRPRQTVSANIIAGKRAELQLHWCLDSIRHVADEIIVVDTGMSPEARRIAEQHGVRIVPGPDPIQGGFEAPRNEGLKYCHGDWILWLDTDECLIEPHNTEKYLRENCFHGYSIRQHHFACDTTFKPDLPVRLFRNRPLNGKSMRWFGMIHEHPEVGLNEGPGLSIILGDVHIAHTGYLIESGRRKRFSRNYPMLQRDIEIYPDRMLQKHFIMRDNVLLATYELQQNGGRVTESVRQRCLETVDLWRKHFRGRGTYMNVDSLEYYSSANRILGQGFEFAFSFAAGKEQAQLNGAHTYRFASMEDVEAELAWRVKDTVGPFAHAWY